MILIMKSGSFLDELEDSGDIAAFNSVVPFLSEYIGVSLF